MSVDRLEEIQLGWKDNYGAAIANGDIDWLISEVERLRGDQQDWRKGVALIASAVGITDTLSCVAISQRVLEQAAEVERLTHLHNLDHSLADQWQKKNEELLGLLENIKRLLGRSKEYVYQGRGLPELRAKFLAEIDEALATA